MAKQRRCNVVYGIRTVEIPVLDSIWVPSQDDSPELEYLSYRTSVLSWFANIKRPNPRDGILPDFLLFHALPFSLH